MTARNETVPNLPVAVGPASARVRGGEVRADARFAAQLLGADGQRRGLKGGPPVLEAARAAYLRAQWSGAGDRRLPPGVGHTAAL